MDSFELNKIIGAILGTLLFVMGIGFLAEAIYEPIEDNGPGYELAEAEPAEHGGPVVEQPLVSIAVLLASADPAAGEASARKCQSCHTFVEGGPNGQGPNLYGVVGRPIASHEGFAYSQAMLDHAKAVPNWTYEELNAFITAPKAHVPGTKMNYAGVKPDPERANIIAFLSTLSPSPVPFPAPEAAPAEAPVEGAATPAEGAAEPVAAEPAPVTTPTATQSETPVEGTATQSNTPAGAEPAPAVETPAAEAAPAATPAVEPAPATDPAPATPEPAPATPAAEPTPAPAAQTPATAPATTTTP